MLTVHRRQQISTYVFAGVGSTLVRKIEKAALTLQSNESQSERPDSAAAFVMTKLSKICFYATRIDA